MCKHHRIDVRKPAEAGWDYRLKIAALIVTWRDRTRVAPEGVFTLQHHNPPVKDKKRSPGDI